MDDSGCPRITDFDLASMIAGLAEHPNPLHIYLGKLNLNVQWAAPEILKGGRAHDQEADIFSYGMVMVEARYGSPP